MWMIIIQPIAGSVFREEWGYTKPNTSDLDYIEEHWEKQTGLKHTVVNIFMLEEGA